MQDDEGRFVLTYNGEIYNYLELKQELESAGLRFRGSSDTEVILRGYKHWGLDCLKKLNGIFAFAIWDRREKTLLLARDPVGVKPLFFSEKDGRFLFASEIKGILSQAEVSREYDEEAIFDFLHFNYVAAPRTGYSSVRQLMPGECVLVNRNGIHSHSIKSIEWPEHRSSVMQANVAEAFWETFRTRVQAQTMADVPVGAFLSGGLDSSAVAAALKQNRCNVTLFHARFEGDYDESPAARATAKALGMKLVELQPEADARDLPQLISKHLEEPTADSSALAMYLLCRETAKHSKVALSGDGADELLAGYETFRATLLSRKLSGGIFGLPLALARRISRFIPPADTRYSFQQKWERFFLHAGKPFPFDHANWRTIFHDGLKRYTLDPGFLARQKNRDPARKYAAFANELPGSASLLDRMLHMDFSFYLPNDMLVKVDRMSMAHGLEVRVPFLDLEMIQAGRALPDGWKLRGKQRKVVLRSGLESRIPAEVLSLPKAGFNFPVEKHLRTTWWELIQDLLATYRNEISNYLQPGKVVAMLQAHKELRRDYRHELFGILMFLLWIHNSKTEWKN